VELKNTLMESIYTQLFAAFALAIPVGCVAWTVTHEEIFREPREYCVKRSQNSATLLKRKFFYLFTCEYCFSHYVTAFFLIVTGFKLYFEDWRGYLLSFFTVVYIANLYMSLFGFLRQNLKAEKIEAKLKDTELKEVIKEKENK